MSVFLLGGHEDRAPRRTGNLAVAIRNFKIGQAQRAGYSTRAMSKKIPLTGVLVGLLLLVSMANVAFCLRYVRLLYAAQSIQLQARRLETQTLMINRNRAVFQTLATEAIEYSKKNPAMATLLQQYNPLLEQLNLRTKSATPAASKPAGR